MVEFFRSEPHFHPATKVEFTQNQSRRYIACELEVASADEGSDIEDVVRAWKGSIVEDSSLPDSGFEICTSPAQGDVFCRQISDICDALNSCGARVNSDCGFHVHIDARDLTYWEIRKLILLYAKIEDALFSVCPPSRRSSTYCKPCGLDYLAAVNGTDAKRAVIETLYPVLKGCSGRRRKERIDRIKSDKYQSVRYNALNLHSWVFRGTIECRMAAGTVNADKVINWGLLWAAILDFANQHSESYLRGLQGDGWALLRTVAPSDDIRFWLADRRAKFIR